MMMNMFKRNPSPMGIAMKPGDHILVDLKLDPRLKPTSVAKLEKQGSLSAYPSQRIADSFIGSLSYAVGSGRADDKIYYKNDFGLFGCVHEAWANHWILRTCPEDWWFTIANRVAKAVDDAAQEHHWGSQKVRELFVSHQGKETISVELDCMGIEDADYDFLFSTFSSQVQSRIKVPEYAQIMNNDFSTSERAHVIASQINLMSSMQQFFDYEMSCCGCGLRGLEMKGAITDWEKLLTKLKRLQKILEPIQREINLDDSWWEHVSYVFEGLVITRKSPNDPKVAPFWTNILMDTTGQKWVGGGGSMPGNPVDVDAYTGWLVRLVTGRDKILAEHLQPGSSNKTVKEQLSGYNQVPMKVKLTYLNPNVEDMSTLVAGVVGFQVHAGDKEEFDSTKGYASTEVVPSLEPNHMWAMLLSPRSPLRRTRS